MKEKKGAEGDKGKEDKQDPLSGEETVGEILFRERTKAGFTRKQISEATRISEEILQYLETDNFDMLPARVYVRGFIHNFAGELGLDVEHILEKYEVQTGQTHKSKGDFWEVKEKEIKERRSSVGISKNLSLSVIGVIVVTIIIIFALRSGNDPDVLIPSGLPDLEEIMDKEETRGRDFPVPPSTEDSVRIRNTEKLQEPPYDEKVNIEYIEPLKLKIIANSADTTWFDVITISSMDAKPDTTWLDFILFPGRVKTLTATDAFIFKTIGNAGGFRIEFRGKEIPSLGDKKEVLKNIYFTRDSISLGNN
ncbi:helix-turn-helix domain-containing protein [bacterium]|nr:helix-turn-helix domain-containing protein [bacterium]